MIRVAAFLLLLTTSVLAQPSKYFPFMAASSAPPTCATNTYTVTFLTNVSSTVDTTAYTTPAFTPSSNALLYANIWADAGASGTTYSVANTGTSNLVWWHVVRTNSANNRLLLFVTQLPQGVSPFSMTVTVTGSSTLTGCEMHINQITGANSSALWGSNAIVQSTSALMSTGDPWNIPFPAEACGSNAIVLNYHYIATATTTSIEPSWSLLLETGHTSPTGRQLSFAHNGAVTNLSSVWVTNAAVATKLITMMEVR